MRPLHLALLSLCLLPSCAYVQTHKNVRERGRVFPGYQLEKPRQLYHAASTWYVAATPATWRQHHDPLHDNVFRDTDPPSMQLLELSPSHQAFHPISSHTAAILLRADGYAEQESLARELAQNPDAWTSSLPHASVHAVRAQVAGAETAAVTSEPSPAEPSFTWRALSHLDWLVVDAPATVAYNVAVPFMAPFVFFHEFLSE